jgi:hypothetical protein
LLVAGLLLLAVMAVIFLNSTKSVKDNPYDLGSPYKIILYYGGKSVEIASEHDIFYSIIDATRGALRNTGTFGAAAANDFPEEGIESYFYETGSNAGFEIVYNKPVKMNFIGKKDISCLFIDLDAELLFYRSAASGGRYKSGAYPLNGGSHLPGIKIILADTVLSRPANSATGDNRSVMDVTGYITAEIEGDIVVVSSEVTGTDNPRYEVYRVAISEKLGVGPLLGQKVAVKFDKVVDDPFIRQGVAAEIKFLEQPSPPGVRMLADQAVRAALPLLEEYNLFVLTWAVQKITFEAGSWLITFANGFSPDIKAVVSVDDEAGTTTLLRPPFIINKDLSINGRFLIGESSSKVVQFFGEPLLKGKREKQESWSSQDHLVYWDTWKFKDMEISFFSSQLKDKPEPVNPGQVYVVYITGETYETFRGVRVGDPVERVLEQYGGKSVILDGTLRYEGTSLEVVEFEVERGKVTGIILRTDFT